MPTVNMNVMVMGMRNRLSKRRRGSDENLTGRLQRHVVLHDERMIKYLILNTNNIVLQIVPNEHHFDFDFHRRPKEIC
jgi:ribose 1,5-bisphosphokinase PhnN